MYEHYHPYGFINERLIKSVHVRTNKDGTILDFVLLDKEGNVFIISKDTYEELKERGY